jgi:signal transduction histidine kinase
MHWFQSLYSKIAFFLIMTQITIMSVFGLIYYNSFSNQVDESLRERIEIPARLLESSRGRLVSLNNTEAVRVQVGENVVDVLVVNTSGTVIFSIRTEFNGQKVTSIAGADPTWFDFTNPQTRIQEIDEQGEPFLVSVTPIHSVVGDATSLFVYTKVGTAEAQSEKQKIAHLMVFGTLITVAITSIILFLVFYLQVFRRMSELVSVLNTVADGDLTIRIPHASSKDEIGVMQRELNSMVERRGQAEKTISELNRDLRTLNAELEQRVIERTQELEIAVEAAERANQVKSQFLASMSHELRTPLNAVINLSQFVADGVMGDVNTEQSDALNLVVGSGQHLLGLINDILDISKIEAGAFKLFVESNADLNPELKTVVATAETLIKDKSVKIVNQMDENLPPITGDKRRITQIMLNLVSNAAKFTEQGSITIRAQVQDDNILLSVEDTGPGIQPEDQQIVFEPFRQTENGLRVGSGTGLGLPISRRLAEAHGGKLWLESDPGKGSQFHVLLPICSKTLEPIVHAQ